MATLQRVVTIAATPRTGSSLICLALQATGVYGIPDEYLLPDRLAKGAVKWDVPTPTVLGRASQWYRRLRGDAAWRATQRLRPDSVRRYLQRMALEHAGTSGTFCWKAMWHHYALYGLDRENGAVPWGVPESWVRIRRDDRLRQAVSLARALETQRWMASQQAIREAVYDPALIARCEAQIAAQEAAWDDYFARRGILPLNLTYEVLATDYHATLARALDHLGHGDVAVPPPQLARQADDVTEDWVSRYRHDRDRGRGQPTAA